MPELTFPINYQFGKIFYRWITPFKYIKAHSGIPGFGYGVSMVDGSIPFGQWLNDNPLVTHITDEAYSEFIQSLFQQIQTDTGQTSGLGH